MSVYEGQSWRQKCMVFLSCGHCWCIVYDFLGWSVPGHPTRWCLISLVANVMLSMQAYRDDVSDFNKWWFKCNDIWVTESKRLRSTFPFDQKVRIHSVAFAVNVKCIFYQIVLVYMSMPEFLRILYHHSKQNALHGVYGKGKCAWREIAILKKIRLFLARR